MITENNLRRATVVGAVDSAVRVEMRWVAVAKTFLNKPAFEVISVVVN